MNQVLQLSFDGIVIGMLYAVVGLGVVIVYRTTNVLNFAQGAVATIGGYLAWTVSSRVESFQYGFGLLAAVVIGALLGVVVGALTTFVLKDARPLTKSVATLGAFLIFGWASRVIFGDLARTLPRPFAGTVTIAGVSVGGHGLFIVVMAAIALLITFWLIERTRLGLAMRALAQDEDTARSHGVSLAWTSLAAWGIASGLGAASGVFVGSFIQVDHSVMTTILIQSIAALVLGGFGTAGGAVVGGLVLGVVSSLIAGLANPGYKNTFVFLLILAVLILRPSGIVGKVAITVPESGSGHADAPALPIPRSWRLPHRLLLGVAGAALIVAIPFLPHPFSLRSYSVMLAVAIAVISLSFFMGWVGEISLGHGALVTIGGYTTGLLLVNHQVDLGVALLASALAAGLVGGLLGLITLRLSGLYLGIATLALSFVTIEFVLQFRSITGGAGGLGVPTPTLFGHAIRGERPTYYLAAAILGLVIVGVTALIRSSVGHRLVAVRDSPLAAETSGVAAKRYKILAFAISSAIAGVSGSLLVVVVSFIAPADYGLFFSIYVILAVILGGSGSLVGAVLGAAFISLMPVALSRTSGLTDAIFGVTLILFLVVLPGGIRQLTQGRGHAESPSRSGLEQAESELV